VKTYSERGPSARLPAKAGILAIKLGLVGFLDFIGFARLDIFLFFYFFIFLEKRRGRALYLGFVVNFWLERPLSILTHLTQFFPISIN
jgi:hypothetical protein